MHNNAKILRCQVKYAIAEISKCCPGKLRTAHFYRKTNTFLRCCQINKTLGCFFRCKTQICNEKQRFFFVEKKVLGGAKCQLPKFRKPKIGVQTVQTFPVHFFFCFLLNFHQIPEHKRHKKKHGFSSSFFAIYLI